MGRKYKDRVGEINGDFQVLKYLGNETWECQCIHCGVKRTYKTPNLNPKNQCVCTRSNIKIGERFGRLVVKHRDLTNINNGMVYWLCECDCGQIKSVPTKRLKNGNTKSCGCLEKENQLKNCAKGTELIQVDLTGKEFGLLKVLRKATKEETIDRKRKSKVIYWYCQCDCGNYHIACTSDLTTGKVASCGCLNSKGEAKIKTILDENYVSYVPQYKFPDFKGERGKYYAYDFGILNEQNKLIYLIEYDGIQHFDKEHAFSEDGFEKTQKRDKIKNDYAFIHNIPLIRIPYTHFNEIEYKDLDLRTSNFILQKE